jgi:hypothetical protein
MKTFLLTTYIINFSDILYWSLPPIFIFLITCNIFYYFNKRSNDVKITIRNFWNPYKDVGYKENPLYVFMTIFSILFTVLYFLILNFISKHNIIFTFN